MTMCTVLGASTQGLRLSKPKTFNLLTLLLVVYPPPKKKKKQKAKAYLLGR